MSGKYVPDVDIVFVVTLVSGLVVLLLVVMWSVDIVFVATLVSGLVVLLLVVMWSLPPIPILPLVELKFDI